MLLSAPSDSLGVRAKACPYFDVESVGVEENSDYLERGGMSWVELVTALRLGRRRSFVTPGCSYRRFDVGGPLLHSGRPDPARAVVDAHDRCGTRGLPVEGVLGGEGPQHDQLGTEPVRRGDRALPGVGAATAAP